MKASHILTNRTTVNTVRNLTAFGWSSTIIPGVTEVRDWVFHILEIRTALNPVIQLISSFSPDSLPFNVEEFEWIPLTTGRPKADVMVQIHGVILEL